MWVVAPGWLCGSGHAGQASNSAVLLRLILLLLVEPRVLFEGTPPTKQLASLIFDAVLHMLSAFFGKHNTNCANAETRWRMVV